MHEYVVMTYILPSYLRRYILINVGHLLFEGAEGDTRCPSPKELRVGAPHGRRWARWATQRILTKNKCFVLGVLSQTLIHPSYKKVGINILGVVENMSGLNLPKNCAQAMVTSAENGSDITLKVRDAIQQNFLSGFTASSANVHFEPSSIWIQIDVFPASRGGALKMWERAGVEYLRSIPLDPAIAVASEKKAFPRFKSLSIWQGLVRCSYSRFSRPSRPLSVTSYNRCPSFAVRRGKESIFFRVVSI